MTSRPLAQNFPGIFGEDGIARAQHGPSVYGTNWKINRIVTSTTSLADTQLRIYRNTETDGQLVDSTFSGNADTSETDISLQNLESLLFVWSGGTPGATANGIVYGTQEGR